MVGHLKTSFNQEINQSINQSINRCPRMWGAFCTPLFVWRPPYGGGDHLRRRFRQEQGSPSRATVPLTGDILGSPGARPTPSQPTPHPCRQSYGHLRAGPCVGALANSPTSTGPTLPPHGRSTHSFLLGALGYRPPATVCDLARHPPLRPPSRATSAVGPLTDGCHPPLPAPSRAPRAGLPRLSLGSVARVYPG